jgi:hypothetical protein
MSLYQVILFIHAIAVLILSAGIGIEVWLVFRLRRAFDRALMSAWLAPVGALSVLTAVSLGVVELTGAYLTQELHSWEFAWPKLAFWGVVLVGLLGGLSGRRLRTARQAYKAARSDSFTGRSLLRSRFLKISLSMRVFLVVAILLLTVVRYDLVRSSLIVTVAVFLGLLCSLIPIGRQAGIVES